MPAGAKSAPASAPSKGGGGKALPPSGGSSGGGGGGGGYTTLEGTLEKMGGGKTGRGKDYKKRHFRLKTGTLTYCSSAKADAKVLGVISLSGGTVRMDGVNVIVTDTGGREYELRAKTAPEAKKWAEACQNNMQLASGEDDDE